MTFTESIQTCFRKYVEFNGCAVRSEFWWFTLFTFAGSLLTGFFSETLSGIFSLVTLLPSLAVGTRRLHDTDRSGWWQLLYFIPLIGWIVLFIWFAQEEKRPTRFA